MCAIESMALCVASNARQPSVGTCAQQSFNHIHKAAF